MSYYGRGLPVGSDEFFQALGCNDLATVRRLLKAGHPVECRGDGDLSTAINWVTSREAFDLLLEYGFRIDHRHLHEAAGSATATGPLLIRWLVESGIPVNGMPRHLYGNEHNIPLTSTFSISPRILTFRTLIELGSSVTYRHLRDKIQPIHFLASSWASFEKANQHRRELEIINMYYMHFEEMADTLIAHGANVNAIDAYGTTPLAYATISGGYEAVRYFVSKGADLLLPNRIGETPSSVARGSVTKNVVRQLLAATYDTDRETGEMIKKKSGVPVELPIRRPRFQIPPYAKNVELERLVKFHCISWCNKDTFGEVSKFPWTFNADRTDSDLFVTCLKCGLKQRDRQNWKAVI